MNHDPTCPMGRRAAVHALACALLAAATGTLMQPAFGQADAWPAQRPITLIVPYTAGGSVDFAARLVSERLGKRLGQTVVVENAGGAGGTRRLHAGDGAG